MKTKITNWLEKHNYIYGGCLLVASIFMLAFGGAYFGAEAALNNTTVNVNVMPVMEVSSEETK